ncbi:hypothetical protein Pflav_014070 [Phytohabitans flavus]|uniref:Uncharacterized protein n=1 Tax=Phytohabitans flavus TaxID=1076124 RepID=A0A6F8XMG3_9ACTN|nr:hypothetical protein Pflav_014070 [Phytohabitans flavus]
MPDEQDNRPIHPRAMQAALALIRADINITTIPADQLGSVKKFLHKKENDNYRGVREWRKEQFAHRNWFVRRWKGINRVARLFKFHGRKTISLSSAQVVLSTPELKPDVVRALRVIADANPQIGNAIAAGRLPNVRDVLEPGAGRTASPHPSAAWQAAQVAGSSMGAPQAGPPSMGYGGLYHVDPGRNQASREHLSRLRPAAYGAQMQESAQMPASPPMYSQPEPPLRAR